MSRLRKPGALLFTAIASIAILSAAFLILPAGVSADWSCRTACTAANRGISSFSCPGTPTESVCGVAPNYECYLGADDPCPDNFKMYCEQANCPVACDTDNYPCTGCTVASSTIGNSCSPPAGGKYTDRCGSCSCPSGTVQCTSPNKCVVPQSCDPGAVFDPCAEACVSPFIYSSPSTPQGAYISVTGDIKSSAGDFYLADGKAIHADSTSDATSWLNVGNWYGGDSDNDVNLNVLGNVYARSSFALGTVFNVSSSGDLTRIKGVDYAWPAANALGALINNGTGTLSWAGHDSLPGAGTVDTIAEWQSGCTNCVDIVSDTTGTLTVARGGTGATDAATARANLGLGTLATLSTVNSSNWSGAALAVANGGTGATDAATARANLGLGSAIGGSGTLNYVPKFTAGAAIGNSLIYDTGSGVGINTTATGSYMLNVVGSNSGIYGSGAYGVYGNGSTTGVYGTGSVYGLYGTNSNYAVYGNSSYIGVAGGGGSTGVYGNGSSQGVQGASSTGYGVYGSSSANSGTAIYGYETGTSSIGVMGNGTAQGLYGYSASGMGVYGTGTYGIYGSGSSYGVYGSSGSNFGVFGIGGPYGVYGQGTTYGVTGAGNSYGGRFYDQDGTASAYVGYGNYGMKSTTNYSGSNAYGVYADATGSNASYYNYGVYGSASGGGLNYGVYGSGSYAGLYGSGGYGVVGSGTSYGGTFEGSSIGVKGKALTGGTYGVWGDSPYVAVYGTGPTAVWGNASSGGTGVQGSGGTTGYGVYGYSAATGVYGSGTSYGVRGEGGTYGVYGYSASNYGVRGSSGYIGVYGDGTSYGFYTPSASYFGGAVSTGSSVTAASTVYANGGVVIDGSTVIDDGAGWHRTYGNTGWYNGTWGGGWFMQDSTWIRAYSNKNVYTAGTMEAGALVSDGDIWLGNGYTMRGAGRMHFYGPDYFYVLNGLGMIIGKEWGGNGVLQVQGSINLGNNVPVNFGGWRVSEMTSGMTIPYGLSFMYGGGKLIIGTDGSLLVNTTTKANDGGEWKFTFAAPGNTLALRVSGHTKVYQGNLTVQYGNAYKDGGGSWLATSDARTKKDVAPFGSGLDVLEKLRPVEYTYNGLAGTPAGQKGIGFIAQELTDVAPWMLSTKKTKLNPEDDHDTDVYVLDPSSLPFINLNAIKELNERVKALEARNAALEERIKALEELD